VFVCIVDVNVWVLKFQLSCVGFVLDVLLTSCRHFAVGNSSSGKVWPEEVSISRVGAIQILDNHG
jgi:hypothetical protein